jgi:hypothetical protein
MGKILRQEQAITAMGTEARAFAVYQDDGGLISSQKIKLSGMWRERGKEYRIVVTLRFDDECHNKHETFSMTADIRENGREYMGGCCHDEIVRQFPTLAPLVKWHLCSMDGPMHYLANTVYLAGERDCWGMLKGEFRQHTSRGPHQNDGVAGVPNWKLKIPGWRECDVYANEKPAPVVCEWEPCGRTGEGKARELDAARRAAIWPDATDAELCAPDLKARLVARLPGLLADFKAAMLGAGFLWPGDYRG